LDAEIGAALAVLQYIATSPDLGNTNVNIGLVTFSSDAKYHGIYQPADPKDPMKINPTLKTKLTGLRGGGYTNFDDALDKAIDFFQAAPADRSQLMFFLSDGIPNVPGDGDNEPVSSNRINNHISALSYNSELAILNNLGVSRLAVGVGSDSDIRPGYGLALIDNTPDEITGQLAQQVTTTDDLTKVLMTNPVAGTVVGFQIKVNNVVDTSFGLSNIVAGPVGFVYGELIVSGLNPFFGAVNRVRATVTIDFDGNAATTADQHTLSVENVIPGMMQ
jgi:von Willebrand factor type A domain